MVIRRIIFRCLRQTEPLHRCYRSPRFSLRYHHSASSFPRVHQSSVLLQQLPIKHSRIGIVINSASSQLRLSTTSNYSSHQQNATLESRVSKLEQIISHRRLNKQDVHNEIWPILSECAAQDPSDSIEKCIAKAKVANRSIQLCLSEVDQYRVHIWRWLEANDGPNSSEQFQLPTHNQSNGGTNDGTILNQMYNLVFTPANNNLPKSNDNDEDESVNSFSPSTLWNNAPHPSKHMYNLAFSSWRRVIEKSTTTHHSSSINNIQITEKSARQVSSLLSTMEKDYTSDVAFVDAYNTAMDRTRYAQLRIGAALPDVTSYGEVMNVWGQCVGMFHRNRGKKNKQQASMVDNDASLQYMMRLEATAMREIMGLKESMEELSNKPPSSIPDDSVDTEENIDAIATTGHHRRPPLDKPCFNIILATMARQINPSLAEMRLVIQQMMERVMYDLEHSDIELEDEDNPDEHPSMECFPDVVSYNSLIEARASRSSMFASDSSLNIGNKGSGSGNDHLFQSIIIPHQKWSKGIAGKQQWHNDVFESSSSSSSSLTPNKLTASEEEAIFAEQILDEMCNLATLPVRPNIWSYNSIIKAWIHTESDRGLQRAILILQALTRSDADNANKKEELKFRVIDSLSEWSTKLLDKQMAARAVDGKLELYTRKKIANNQQHQEPFVMNPRMALMNAAMQGNETGIQPFNEEKQEPIGPLPHIEPAVSPNLISFQLILSALGQRGTIISAKLSQDLLDLLTQHCSHLNPDVMIYNSVLNAWAKAGKESKDAELALFAAKQARHLLDQMLTSDNEAQLPNETSFLMSINAFANAVSAMSYPLSIHAAKQAEELLTLMMDQPLQNREIATSCFGIVARIWASLSGNPTSRSKVRRHADQAHDIIKSMIEVSDGLSLDLLPFNATLDAYARELSAIPELKNPEDILVTLSKMHNLLTWMRDYNQIAPDASSYNHVFRACYAPFQSKSDIFDDNTRQQVLDLVLGTYSQLNHSTVRPHAHTYLHLLKAINYLLPADRSDSAHRFRLIKGMFEDCCEHGHLTKTTFWTVHSMLGKDSELVDFLHSLTGIDKARLNDNADRLFPTLPREWSRFGCKIKTLNKNKKDKF